MNYSDVQHCIIISEEGLGLSTDVSLLGIGSNLDIRKMHTWIGLTEWEGIGYAERASLQWHHRKM